MIRAAAYIRVSTEEQVLHGYSIDAQREALLKYESEHDDIQIVGWYADEGVSARKKATKRKALQQLLTDLEPKQIDMILFIKLDRWFRNVGEYHKVQEVLDEHGVHWKAILEDYDTSTAGGRLHINIMLSVAQDEADRTSERIKFVYKEKLNRRELLNDKLPLGLTKDENEHGVPDPETAHIAVDLFNHYDQNNSIKSLNQYLYDTYGINRSTLTIKNMLKNRMYIGEYHGIPNFLPALIDKNLFDRVQIGLNANIKKAPSNRIYLFTGLLVCDECGRKMTARAAVRKCGTYIYYRCPAHAERAKLCPHHFEASEVKLEAYLLDHLKGEIHSQICAYDEQEKKRKKPANDKEKIKAKLKRLKDLYVNELIEIAEYKADYDMYTRQLNELEMPENEEPQINVDALNEFLMSDFKTIYAALDQLGKRALWRSIIREIRLDVDNNIVAIKFI